MKGMVWNIYLFLAMGFVIISTCCACKVTRPYKQPMGVAADNLYRGDNKRDSNNIANFSWKELLTDTLLQSIIQQGIDSNLDLKIAVARIKSATANFKQSKLAFFPSADANASGTYQRVPPTQYGFPEAYLLDITSSWEVDLWGRLSSAKKALFASLLQSEAYK